MYNLDSSIDLNIILLSDIHYSNNVNKDVFNKILKKFNEIDFKPDYICIPGDILDESTDFDLNVYNFFYELSKISKVIISLGNHDISKFGKKHMEYYDTKWYYNITDIDNVYLLNNKQIKINNLTFTGYTALYDKNNKYNDNPLNTIKDLSNLNFDTSDYNILLCHSPQSILGNNDLYENEFIKKQNLILCGHMHNGMILPLFDKLFKNNIGLIGPGKKLFPKYARGLIKFNDTTLIICKGFTKLAKHSSILRPLNILFPQELEKIKIKKIER